MPVTAATAAAAAGARRGGGVPAPAHHGPLRKLPRKREAIRQFTPSWFTVVMGTGSVALTLATFPYSFAPAQGALALAVWALAALTFLAFGAMFAGRMIFWPQTIRPMARHPAQSLFLGAIPMAFSTLTNGVVLAVAPYAVRAGAGEAASLVCARASLALYWINVPAVLLAVLIVPWLMFTEHGHSHERMTAVFLLPVVPACVAAGSAGTIAAAFGAVLPARALESLLLSGYALGGAGLFLSLQICTMYMQRLLCFRLPPREAIVSSFLPVGPMAMVSLALVRLGNGAEAMLLSAYGAANGGGVDGGGAAVPVLPRAPGALPTTDASAELRYIALLRAGDGAGLLLALALWGFALWWLAVAVACVGTTLRTLPSCGLGLWGGVFPLGVLVLDTFALAQSLDVPALRAMTAALAACHWLLWLYVMGVTARGAWSGALFVAPCLREQEAAEAAEEEAERAEAAAASAAQAAQRAAAEAEAAAADAEAAAEEMFGKRGRAGGAGAAASFGGGPGGGGFDSAGGGGGRGRGAGDGGRPQLQV